MIFVELAICFGYDIGLLRMYCTVQFLIHVVEISNLRPAQHINPVPLHYDLVELDQMVFLVSYFIVIHTHFGILSKPHSVQINPMNIMMAFSDVEFVYDVFSLVMFCSCYLNIFFHQPKNIFEVPTHCTRMLEHSEACIL